MKDKTKKSVAIGASVLGLIFCRVVFAQNLYISQVQITGGAGNANQDFIELFNPNQTSVNLKGYRLIKRSAKAQKDTAIKVWDKNTVIPPNSFYLWANNKYKEIRQKPNITSSVTLAEDNGIALRKGSNNFGAIIDSLAWGKAGNGFPVVAGNPAANQSITREDLHATVTKYAIVLGVPHNSSQTDLMAQFAAYEQPKTANVQSSVQKTIPTSNSNYNSGLVLGTATTSLATLPPVTLASTTSSATIALATVIPSYSSGVIDHKTQSKQFYLILAAVALVIFAFLAVKIFPRL